MPLPPPSPIYDIDSNFIGIDTLEYANMVSDHNKLLQEIENYDSREVISLNEYFISLDSNNLINRKDINLNDFVIMDTSKMSFEKMGYGDNYKLILESERKKEFPRIFKAKKNSKFVGVLDFSRIYINKTDNTAIFQIDFYCDQFNSFSSFIIIEKANGKWRIKERINNWVT